jgi:hypothetical protein
MGSSLLWKNDYNANMTARDTTKRKGTIVEFFEQSPLRGSGLEITRVKDGPRSCLEWLAKNAVDVPELPTDLAHQHDHYLYGSPKKKD